MTRQPSTDRQHCVLRGQAVLPIVGRPADGEGMWSYQRRWRD